AQQLRERWGQFLDDIEFGPADYHVLRRGQPVMEALRMRSYRDYATVLGEDPDDFHTIETAPRRADMTTLERVDWAQYADHNLRLSLDASHAWKELREIQSRTARTGLHLQVTRFGRGVCVFAPPQWVEAARAELDPA